MPWPRAARVRLALALLPAVVTPGDAYLFHRLGGFSGGVSLVEPLLLASSLTRSTRNTGTEVHLPEPKGGVAAAVLARAP